MHLFKCQRFSHRRASGCINTRWSSTPHSTVVLCCLLSLWKTGISRSTTPFVSTSTCCFQCSRRVNWGSMCIYFERTLHVLLMSLLAILFLPWMTRKGPYFSPSKFDHYYVLFGTWFFNVLRVAQLNEAWFSLHNHRFFKRVFADRRSLDGPLHWYGNLLEFGRNYAKLLLNVMIFPSEEVDFSIRTGWFPSEEVDTISWKSFVLMLFSQTDGNFQ